MSANALTMKTKPKVIGPADPWMLVDTFMEACKDGNLPLVKTMLFAGQDINAKHKYGWTALMVATVNGQTNVVQYLLESGANPDLVDEYDPYANLQDSLRSFSYRDSWDVRKVEFTYSMDHTRSYVGWTALHYAAAQNHTAIIELLFTHGVTSSAVNRNGETALDLSSGPTKELIAKWQSLQEERRCIEVFQRVRLKDILQSNLIGQTLAIDEVCNAITRLENGWINDKHPLVLMFVGATGLGKTEMAKLLAKYLRGNSKDAFLHVNLSEYSTEHEAAKFTGAPPGYVGYATAGEGQLLTILNKNPRAVVLFDEADKAHPNVLATLLQLFDEGRLTSGSGKTVECNEALFILTANLAVKAIGRFGAELREIQKESSADELKVEKLVEEFKEALRHGPLKDAFKRDELLGRVNELAIFFPFSTAERKQVIEHQLRQLKRLAATRHGVTLNWHEDVLDFLDASFNEKYGVRNLKHEIDRQVVTKLSKAQEAALYQPGDFLHLEVRERLGATCTDKGSSKPSEKAIRLCKLSPMGQKEDLDSKFADISDVFQIVRC